MDNSTPFRTFGTMLDLYRGERYWFNTEDENVMTENNQEFQVMPVAEQLFHEYFRGGKRRRRMRATPCH